MKSLLTASILLLLAVINTYAQEPQGTEPSFGQTGLEWIAKEIKTSLKENDVPALSVAIVQNGKVELLTGYGLLNRNLEQKADAETIYQIASLSKMLTGIIASHLIAEGVLEKERSIVYYLPSTLSDKTRDKLKKIKVEDLLHHRSGIPRNSEALAREDGEPMSSAYTEEYLLADLDLLELAFEPGTEYAYSNIGYALLGYILEQASGEKYEELLRVYVAGKEEMLHTTTALSSLQEELVATPYRKDSRGTETKAWNTGKLTPASGIYSNVADLSKLMVRQIKDYNQFYRHASATPLVLSRFKEKKDSEDNYYGFGITETVTSRGVFLGHKGDMDGFAGTYIFSPQHQLGLVMLTSSGGKWIGALAANILKKLEEDTVSTN